MNRRQKYELQSFRRAQAYLDTNAAAVDTVNASGARKTFDDIVAQLTDDQVSQDTLRNQLKADVARISAARDTLRTDHMRPIARIAAAKLKSIPEFKALALPGIHIDSEALLNAAREMSEAAAPYAQVFTGTGLAPDFLTKLRGPHWKPRRPSAFLGRGW